MVVVAAVDESESRIKVLEQADTLAEKFEDTVHVLHVMTRSEAIKTEEESTQKNEPMNVEELRHRAAEVSEDLLRECPLTSDTECQGMIGDPATEIVNYSEEVDARYIIVSPKRQSKTGKLLFGSVAQSVLLNSKCPVVSIHVD